MIPQGRTEVCVRKREACGTISSTIIFISREIMKLWWLQGKNLRVLLCRSRSDFSSFSFQGEFSLGFFFLAKVLSVHDVAYNPLYQTPPPPSIKKYHLPMQTKIKYLLFDCIYIRTLYEVKEDIVKTKQLSKISYFALMVRLIFLLKSI